MANANPNAADTLRARLTTAPGGLLPWVDVMRFALYDPEAGYYRGEVRRIGRAGDFFTSVSVGPVFGELLAQFCVSVWESCGRPSDFHIVEQGAHDGTLAKDVLEALRASHSDAFARTRYVIVEPDAGLRQAQCATLGEALAEKLLHVGSLDQLGQRRGVLLCNELLDAFPVHRVRFVTSGEQQSWQELFVRATAGGGFEFVPAPPSTDALRRELDRLGDDFADGCTTEVNLEMIAWLEEVVRTDFHGPILIADYGHAAREFLAPERSKGTLRRYRSHQCDDRVLEGLGECDLTAHVNFTRLAEEAGRLGLDVCEFIEQGRFLTRLAGGLVQQPSFRPDPAWLRQFQTLTHPGHLGQSFQVMILAGGEDRDRVSTEAQRQAALNRLGMASHSG